MLHIVPTADLHSTTAEATEIGNLREAIVTGWPKIIVTLISELFDIKEWLF